MFTEYSFTKRLLVLIGIDLIVTEIDSYVPQDWWPLRLLLATVQLGFMALTMGVAVGKVLEDF
jgi:hypothetical protein